MSNFTTRVELYGNATYETYDALHAAMQSNGFSKQVIEDGVTYDLPTAEYISEHQLPIAGVKMLAIKIAQSVWNDFGILVTATSAPWEIHNLRKSKR